MTLKIKGVFKNIKTFQEVIRTEKLAPELQISKKSKLKSIKRMNQISWRGVKRRNRQIPGEKEGDKIVRLRRLREPKSRFSEIEREEMRQFADMITPKKWNIFLNHKNYRREHGVLNIFLDIRNADEEADPDVHGKVHGGLAYLDWVADTIVILQPQICNWKDLLIHELAHVAVLRSLSFKEKTYLKLVPYVGNCRGEFFKMIKRTPQGDFIRRGTIYTRPMHRSKTFRASLQQLKVRAERLKLMK